MNNAITTVKVPVLFTLYYSHALPQYPFIALAIGYNNVIQFLVAFYKYIPHIWLEYILVSDGRYLTNPRMNKSASVDVESCVH